MTPRSPVVAAQDAAHGLGHDYDLGSPHLRHPQLRGMVEDRLAALVARTPGRCRVLEVGAGHGTFTRCLLAAGAEVTVTEASAASAGLLRRRFGDRVEVLHDRSGEQVLGLDRSWDLAVMTSVLHHIPDYLGFVERLCALLAPGGALLTVQDPLFYPRRTRLAHRLDRGAYFAWRVAQGNYRRGLATRLRRVRGVYDESPSDLVEYHVMRQGVDELALEGLLRSRFAEVELFRYWSTQSPLLQRLGERTRLVSTFGLEARGAAHLEM